MLYLYDILLIICSWNNALRYAVDAQYCGTYLQRVRRIHWFFWRPSEMKERTVIERDELILLLTDSSNNFRRTFFSKSMQVA